MFMTRSGCRFLQQVEESHRSIGRLDTMNSPAFVAQGGTGLLGLAQELRPRCEELVRLKGERLPK